MSVKFTKTEWHQVSSEFTYELEDDDIIEQFGSVERFKEVLSHQDQETFGGMEPEGEEPTEEENDALWEITYNYEYERYDDWWTDRKGGYDITFNIVEDEE